MTIEERELYCYVTCTEPFMTQINNVSMSCVSPLIAIRKIVKKAIEKYHKDYCTSGDECFSHEDFIKVSDKIYFEKRGM